MSLSKPATRELLALAFAASATHFALHSGTPCTTANQLGSRVAITWGSTTTLTTDPADAAKPANRLDGATVTLALAATTAAPYGAYWSASTAGTNREEVATNFPSGSARNVTVDPKYYQS